MGNPPKEVVDKYLVPQNFILSLVSHMAVPEEKVILTLCRQLRRINEISSWHLHLFTWHLPSFEYIVGRRINLAIDGDTEGAAHLNLTIPQKGDEVIATLRNAKDAKNGWVSFPYNDMFLIGRFEEMHASRIEDHRVEGPYAGEYPDPND